MVSISAATLNACHPALPTGCTLCLSSFNTHLCGLCRHITEEDLAFFQERVEQDAVIPGAGKWEHMTDLSLDSLTYTAWRRRLPVSVSDSNLLLLQRSSYASGLLRSIISCQAQFAVIKYLQTSWDLLLTIAYPCSHLFYGFTPVMNFGV